MISRELRYVGTQPDFPEWGLYLAQEDGIVVAWVELYRVDESYAERVTAHWCRCENLVAAAGRRGIVTFRGRRVRHIIRRYLQTRSNP